LPWRKRGFNSRWAFWDFRTWESLVLRVLREHEIVGSNPTVLTRLRWGPCWYGRAPVKRHVAGSIPATAAFGQNGRSSRTNLRSVPAMAAVGESGRAISRTMLRMVPGSTPSPSALRALGRAAEAPAFQAGQAGSIPAGHSRTMMIGDRSTAGRLALNQGTKVRLLLPELRRDRACLQGKPMRGHPKAGCDALNVVMLVQVQPPQLRMMNVESQMTKESRSSNGPMATSCFDIRSFLRHLDLIIRPRGHGPTGRHQHRTLKIRVRLPVTPLTTVPWSNGHDTWPTPRKRWFNSIRDHWERMRDER
jgi:hypothetical protein